MDDQTPAYKNTQPIPTPSPISPSDKHGKGFLFEVIFVIVFLVILFVILNYFNILMLSEIFPNQLNWLPQRTAPNGKPQQAPIISPQPTQESFIQEKETLNRFLAVKITSSLLPLSISDIKLTSNKEGFFGSWVTKEGVGGVNFDISSDSNKITALSFRFQKIQPTSPSPELAKSTTTELFYVNPKGTWLCTQIATGTSYCENFWEEQSKDAKTGLGFQINSLSDTSARFIFSFCEHTKESNLYSWKSCRSEFAQTGVK